MKNALIVLNVFFLFHAGHAQENGGASQSNIVAKWAPTGLILGSASLLAEYNFGGRNSLTVKIGFPANAHHRFTFDNNEAGFNMKATSFLAGYRTYFSGKNHLKGFYYEPFFKYVHHTSDGVGTGTLNNRLAAFDFTNNYNGVGIGLQLGAQFFIGRHFVIDLFFFGPEINSATNTFKAREASSVVPWTYVDAKEVERDVRDFIDQFPFVRNKTTVMVDRENRRVFANFKGALPGVRTGVSVGFAF